MRRSNLRFLAIPEALNHRLHGLLGATFVEVLESRPYLGVVSHDGIEARAFEFDGGDVGVGGDGRGPRPPRQQRDLAEEIPEAEFRQQQIGPVLGFGEDLDDTADDEKQTRTRLAFRHDDVACVIGTHFG